MTAGVSSDSTYYYAAVPTGTADPGLAAYHDSIPKERAAGTYDVFYVKIPSTVTTLVEDDLLNAQKIKASIAKKQVVYFLTAGTYAVGDAPDVTNHYSIASGSSFVGNDKLEDFATFQWADSGNDKLDLDANGRFTKKATYNITALKVVLKPVQQNYDFRFTSTATIVVAGKSIAGFVAYEVPDQTYTGNTIKFETAPDIYATEADRNDSIALDPSNYTVSYGKNINVVYDNNGAVTYGGTIIYTGIGNYEDSLKVYFKIQPRELVKVTVDALDDTTYTRKAIVPVLTNKVHGLDSLNTPYTLAATDFTVNYEDANHNATNINAGTAKGIISFVGGKGNFVLDPNAPANAVDSVKFEITKKSLGDPDIEIELAQTSYSYKGKQILPDFVAHWTTRTTVPPAASDSIINDFTVADSAAYENIAVGKGYIKVVPKATNNPQNYEGFKTVPFDIIPTDLVSEHAEISFVKHPTDSTTVPAVYYYTGKPIKPGKKVGDEYVDGELLVTIGTGADQITLEQGVDYEIVENKYGADVTIGVENFKGENTKASKDAPTKTRGTVTIQGIGNFGKINNLAEPITKSAVFTINKKQLRLSAAPNKSTIYGTKPCKKFAYTDNTVEDSTKTAEVLLGGKVTYKLLSYDPRPAHFTGYAVEDTASVVLAISDSTRAYKYVPVWTTLPADTAGVSPKIEGVTYQSAAQKAARANYDLGGTILTDSAEFVINAAKWFIVPDSLSKKYMVTDGAIGISNKYKVYAGSTLETAELVASPTFEVAPVIGRKEADKGEDVIVTSQPGVYGSYTVSVLNDSVNGVRKPGYEIECLTGKLTILPFPITITANDQTVLYGGAPNTDTTINSWIRTVNANGEEVDGDLLTVTYSPVMFGNQSLISRDSLGLTLEWDSVATVSATPHANALIPHITNTNFAPTYVNGSLTVIAGNIMVLGRTDAKCKDQIIAHDGVQGVTVKFETRELKAETWQAMAFPFPVSVAEFSNAIYNATGGYAVVNILDEDNTADKPAFKLWMREIEANQPFLFKVYNGTNNDETLKTFDMKDLQFTGKKITYAQQAESEDARGNKFFGIYETTTLANKDGEPKLYWLFNHKSGKFSKYTGNSRTIDPMTGYLKTATEIDAFARITVVEEDGTVTAISTINADGEAVKADGWYTINGVKLQGMPTEKGVYIQNGKKVVLK